MGHFLLYHQSTSSPRYSCGLIKLISRCVVKKFFMTIFTNPNADALARFFLGGNENVAFLRSLFFRAAHAAKIAFHTVISKTRAFVPIKISFSLMPPKLSSFGRFPRLDIVFPMTSHQGILRRNFHKPKWRRLWPFFSWRQ